MALMFLSPAVATARPAGLGPEDRALLATYARDTWRSIESLGSSGALPADMLRREVDVDVWVAGGPTSPSNVAAYLWSTVAAEKLRLIDRVEAGQRLGRTLGALARLERSNGFFYNWYDPVTGARSLTWPGGGVVRPFLSSVDNGWLAAALMLVGNARPDLRAPAEAVLAPMDFGFFYNAFDRTNPIARPGLLRGGFWPEEGTFTEFHYGTLNTEPRIASYVGIARGQVPGEHYYRMIRAAGGPVRTYAGVPVEQGSADYAGMRLVPSWDGTMFEALMVSLLVPEAEWAPASWGVNHPLYVRAQIEEGRRTARGFWGVSASSDPDGGYHAFGVAGIGTWSRLQPAEHGRLGVITPHATFLALRHAPREAMANLRALAAAFPAIYGEHGFLDSVDVLTGRVSDRVLVLDQGMILAAIANALDDDVLVRTFSAGAVEATIRPLIAPERFEARREPVVGEPVVGDAPASGRAVPIENWKGDGPSVPPIPRPHLPAVAQPEAGNGPLRDAAEVTLEGRAGQP